MLRSPALALSFLVLVILNAAPLRAAEASASDLATGIRQVQQGDFEGAIVTLGGVARSLQGQAARRQELAQAHLYLGIAHVALDQLAEAKVAFKAALAQNKDLRLTEDRFSPKVIAAFEEARREIAPAASGARPGRGKPLLWVAVGGAAAGAVAIAATAGGGDGAARMMNARFATPVIECPDGSVGLELAFSILVDVDNATGAPLAVTAVEAVAVIEASPQLPSEVGFSSRRPSRAAPTSVPARTTATLRVDSSLLCGNGVGDPARSNTWRASVSFNTSAGVFNVETANHMRVDVP